MIPEIKVKVSYLHALCKEKGLEYATEHSAGLDLRACLGEEKTSIPPGNRLAISTGVAIEIVTAGIAGFIFSRSGLGTKQGLVVSQGVGVIDPDYRGEIIVSLLNSSPTIKTVEFGQRIAQLIFLPVYQARLMQVDELSPTRRGQGGFGHTGVE